MKLVRRLLCTGLLGVYVLQTAPLFALEPSAQKQENPGESKPVDETRAEAAARFERALKLFNAGDTTGALAEFKRIYEISPNPVVLYNIGLVYAAMGRPVEAVDALDRVLTSGGLSASELERAKLTLSDQQARVARLTVTTTPEPARIEIDDVYVATTPLSSPIRLSEGSHIVGAVATGYAASRREVVVAGNSDTSLHIELIPSQKKQLANLSVHTRTAGAEVVVDGTLVGHTPLASSIALPAGRHVVELRRPGYGSIKREIDLGEGASGELRFDLRVDASALSSEGATLVLDASESPLELAVDGNRYGIYRGPVRLPKGPHHLTVQAAGFVPRDLDVNLDATRTNVVEVALDPTPETRRAYERSANFHRTWGLIGIIGGAVIGGAGATFFALSNSAKHDAQDDLEALQAKDAASEPPCDWSEGYASQGEDGGAECRRVLGNAKNDVDQAETRAVLGLVGVGVGGALAVTGLVLLLTGEDPHKYDRAPEHARRSSSKPRLALVPGPGEIGAGLRLSF